MPHNSKEKEASEERSDGGEYCGGLYGGRGASCKMDVFQLLEGLQRWPWILEVLVLLPFCSLAARAVCWRGWREVWGHLPVMCPSWLLAVPAFLHWPGAGFQTSGPGGGGGGVHLASPGAHSLPGRPQAEWSAGLEAAHQGHRGGVGASGGHI